MFSGGGQVTTVEEQVYSVCHYVCVTCFVDCPTFNYPKVKSIKTSPCTTRTTPDVIPAAPAFTTFHTSTFGYLGPFAVSFAFSSCFANKYIRRQTSVRHCDAIISWVSSDLPVINYHPKLWDWSETTGHSYERSKWPRSLTVHPVFFLYIVYIFAWLVY